MTLGRLVWANLMARKLSAVLTLTLLSLGTATIVLLLLVGHQVQDRMTRDGKGIDLVIGAKGSPLQLILSSVYHLDVPVGNIPKDEVDQLLQSPMTRMAVKAAIPLALGDNVHGFRIVGTTPAYVERYDGTVQGRLWEASMEAVVGAEVARQVGLKTGDTFVGSHGLTQGGEAHEHQAYTVVGVLNPTGSVLDRLAITSIESVWDIHEHHEDGGEEHHGEHQEEHHEDEDHKEEEANREYTSVLLSTTSIGAVTLPRLINAQSSMMAAQPAYEMARLYHLMGVGLEALRAFGALLVVIAGVSVFVALYNALRERQVDMAILRTLGATPGKLFASVLLEGLVLSVVGVTLGLVMGHGAVHLLGLKLAAQGSLPLSGTVWVSQEGFLAGAALLVGLLAAVPPAVSASRTDIAATLAKGG